MRVPLVAGVVAVAGVLAAVRSLHPQARAVTTFSSTDSSAAFLTAERRRAAEGAPAKVVVYVAGDVARAGVYTFAPGARAVDALRAAGGALAGADLVAVNLATPLTDGEEIAVPVKGASVPARTRRRRAAQASDVAQTTDGSRRRRGKKRRRASTDAIDGSAVAGAASEPVDLNAADESALETLPGIGPGLAERIVVVRDQSGPFASLDDLLDVAGMTQSKLDELEPYVTLH